MSAGVRVAAFGALLAAIFALATVAGRALDPGTAAGGSTHAAHGSADAHAAHGGATASAGDDGGLRRDLRRFQHLHPVQDASGAWSVALTLPDAGVYHAFADFTSAGTRHTLGTDLFAAGRFEPLALPAPSTRASVDGYDVALREQAGGTRLGFSVSRAGAPVADLQPYLGAYGHLVMLRAGDLTYEHVHPLATTGLDFETAASPPGTYRLFLEFRHGGAVHTAAFTRTVAR